MDREAMRELAVGAFGAGCQTDLAADLACNRDVEVTAYCPVGSPAETAP